MYTSMRMRKLIEGVAQAHNFNLEAADGSELVISSKGYMDLHIIAYGPALVRVAHIYYSNGDAVYDPDMCFYTNVLAGYGWIPVAIEQPLTHIAGHGTIGGYTCCTWFDEQGNISKFEPRLQRELASFANTWATNIRAQGFASSPLVVRYTTRGEEAA